MPGKRPGSLSDLDELRSLLSLSPVFVDALHRARDLGLPGWYLAAGCVAQTVWNLRTGRPLEHGIRDYDLPYFDSQDLSWEAEDRAIRAGYTTFAGLPCQVEIRNEARVHLWYEEHFGAPCRPYASTEAAIASFPTTATCVGARLEEDDSWKIFAPCALSDLLGLVVRPNLVLAPQNVYEAKVTRWRTQWPSLTVESWPGSGQAVEG